MPMKETVAADAIAHTAIGCLSNDPPAPGTVPVVVAALSVVVTVCSPPGT